MEISTRTEDGELVLCASSIYNQKFYLNKEFSKLPDEIKDELHAMCGAFTQEVGGIFMLVFDDAGNLKIQTRALEDDLLFDDIGCGLKVKKPGKKEERQEGTGNFGGQRRHYRR